MDDKLLRQIVEVNYLSTENTWRYRAILRFFYLQHEKLRHYLFPEEVYEYLLESPHFAGYTREQLQQDLDRLVEWRNLVPRQDMGKVQTIEEFRKKRYRYQCTPYTVEIERMVQVLEEKGDSFGGSLERTLFDRLQNSLLGLDRREEVLKLSPEELYDLWGNMYEEFRKLTENATDYLAHLESEKVEELMLSGAFLVYKDRLTDYLSNFVTALQRSSFRLEQLLPGFDDEYIDMLVDRLTVYYLDIPRLDETPEREPVWQRFSGQWQSLKGWFLGRDGRESDLSYLQNATNETIRRLTRFAQRLGERHHNLQSRRKDYLALAGWFARAKDLEQAHRLFACVFGVIHTRHLFATERETEDFYAQVWDEAPTEVIVNPRVRQYRPKIRPQAVVSRRKEKNEALAAYLLRKEAEASLLGELARNDRVVLAELKYTDPHIRRTLLQWIGKCMGNRRRVAKTENGRSFRLVDRGGRITLPWEDGMLEMPNYEIRFLD